MNELRPALVLRQTTAGLRRQSPDARVPGPRLPAGSVPLENPNTDFGSSGKNVKDEFSRVVLGFLELVL